MGQNAFSPHTRGCSGLKFSPRQDPQVFPAYAGMFRGHRRPRPRALRFPRIRGDVPPSGSAVERRKPFSPHTRGCSRSMALLGAKKNVFPAYAGMFRRVAATASLVVRFPRIRGDVPQAATFYELGGGFSPHTRGCSVPRGTLLPLSRVFPAYAGMFLGPIAGAKADNRFPRIRGDVPGFLRTTQQLVGFSPHTRGCSVPRRCSTYLTAVFPAYAGMFRRTSFCKTLSTGFPRIRGDVPAIHRNRGQSPEFSPHTRGCSDDELFLAGNVEVFPAYAGMFRTFAGADSRDSSFPRIRGVVP